MQAFEYSALLGKQSEFEQPYLEFIREDSLSAGLYVLPAGGIDKQRPHTEDEVYYVIQGRGRIMVAEEERAVEAGSIIFVAAGVEHRFYNITEDLHILVFFAPAEGANQP